jgi:hypothetical protein
VLTCAPEVIFFRSDYLTLLQLVCAINYGNVNEGAARRLLLTWAISTSVVVTGNYAVKLLATAALKVTQLAYP